METGISHETIEQIISDHLQLKKIPTRWVSNILTDARWIERVRFCEENLQNFIKKYGAMWNSGR